MEMEIGFLMAEYKYGRTDPISLVASDGFA